MQPDLIHLKIIFTTNLAEQSMLLKANIRIYTKIAVSVFYVCRCVWLIVPRPLILEAK